MAILYVFTINNPNPESVADFPPSVLASDWLVNLQKYFSRYAIGGYNANAAVIFEDQTALNSFINEYKLSDASLLSDISTWKSTYGITYTTKYYTVTEANITPTPDPIVS